MIVLRSAARSGGVPHPADVEAVCAGRRGSIASRAAAARDVEALRAVSDDLDGLARALHGAGLRAWSIGRVISAATARIMERLWQLTLAGELAGEACLIVMGSQGRGEQILKTDQDNGVILRDGVVPRDFEPALAAFSARLIEFGYPLCPGGIMVTNPAWARTASGYGEALRRWISRPDPDALLDLAIFLDASAAAGDDALLYGVKADLFARLGDNDALLTQFARAALSFDTPLGLFGRLAVQRDGSLDIKKGGIFTIVHGLRSLALEQRIWATNSFDRLDGLAAAGVLEASLAADLSQALAALMDLRLNARLEPDAAGNLIRPAALGRMERRLLKEAFRVVRRFKNRLTYHFRLQMV